MATPKDDIVFKRGQSTFVEHFVLPDGRSGVNAGPTSSDDIFHRSENHVEPNATIEYARYIREQLKLPELSYLKKIRQEDYEKYVGPYKRTQNMSGYQLVATRTGLARTLGYRITIPQSFSLDALSQDRKLNQKLLEKIKDMKVNLAQVYAERQKTADLFVSTVTRVAGFIRAARRGDLAGAAKALGAVRPSRRGFKRILRAEDAVSRAVLEFQYGVKPLLSDLHGAAQALAEYPFRQNLNKVTVESKINLIHNTRDVMIGSQSPGVDLRGSGTVTYVRARKMAVTFYTDLSLPNFGFTNPAALAWELLPWSFVIDWLLPIGDWINTWDAALGCHLDDGYSSTLLKVVSLSETESRGYANETFLSRHIFTEIESRREKVITFPSPTFPPFKNPYSPEHVLNACALLSQLRK